MESSDMVGWMAAGLMLAGFSCKDERWLRMLALAANVSFIAYGIVAGLTPVVALHLILVPVNVVRLSEAVRKP